MFSVFRFICGFPKLKDIKIILRQYYKFLPAKSLPWGHVSYHTKNNGQKQTNKHTDIQIRYTDISISIFFILNIGKKFVIIHFKILI